MYSCIMIFIVTAGNIFTISASSLAILIPFMHLQGVRGGFSPGAKHILVLSEGPSIAACFSVRKTKVSGQCNHVAVKSSKADCSYLAMLLQDCRNLIL